MGWKVLVVRTGAEKKEKEGQDIPRIQLRQLHKRVRGLLMPALRKQRPREFKYELLNKI
jgi:hypothetical protein